MRSISILRGVEKLGGNPPRYPATSSACLSLIADVAAVRVTTEYKSGSGLLLLGFDPTRGEVPATFVAAPPDGFGSFIPIDSQANEFAPASTVKNRR